MKKIKQTSSERALSIIKSPIMTEKSTTLNQFNKYSFFVSKNSNSQEIKQAIENIFKVKVMKVNTLINRGKLKSFKGSLGYKNDQKKAITVEQINQNKRVDINKLLNRVRIEKKDENKRKIIFYSSVILSLVLFSSLLTIIK